VIRRLFDNNFTVPEMALAALVVLSIFAGGVLGPELKKELIALKQTVSR